MTTNNAFKQFLLHCLYADLRLPSYASLFESFVATVDNPSLIEMCYVKIYELMLLYEGNKIPAALISAFNRAFERRQLLYGIRPYLLSPRLRRASPRQNP